MTNPADAWRRDVAEAASRGDGDDLRQLFEAGRALFGSGVGEEWARALSAFDGTAITG